MANVGEGQPIQDKGAPQTDMQKDLTRVTKDLEKDISKLNTAIKFLNKVGLKIFTKRLKSKVAQKKINLSILSKQISSLGQKNVSKQQQTASTNLQHGKVTFDSSEKRTGSDERVSKEVSHALGLQHTTGTGAATQQEKVGQTRTYPRLTPSQLTERFKGPLSEQTTERLRDAQFQSKTSFPHRYGNVFSPEATKVKVALGGQTVGLHANKVTTASGRTYIAAQGPIEKGENLAPQGSSPRLSTEESQAAFWAVAHENTVNGGGVIVDVSKPGDIATYYPEVEGETKEFPHGVKVTLSEKSTYEGNSDIEIAKYIVFHNGEAHTIRRVHFKGWEDHSGGTTKALKDISTLMNKYGKGNPPIIHCRAGVGRTGTVIVADDILNSSKEKLSEKSPDDALDQNILGLREQRGALVVQTPEQYHTLSELMHDRVEGKV